MNHNFLFTYNDPKMRKYLVVHFRTYLNSIKIKNVTFFITLFIPYFLFVYLHSLPLSLSLSLSIFSVPLHLYPSLSLSLSVLPLIQELLKKENMIDLIEVDAFVGFSQLGRKNDFLSGLNPPIRHSSCSSALLVSPESGGR